MRPRFHYAPRANWLSDPNGLVHHAGEWHMAYQYNPEGEEWGHMAWGHAVSPDLVHWTELSPALVEADGVMIYSGSAVIDRNDTTGFGRDAMVAVYTGADTVAKHQTQCLAHSTDRGRNWTKFPGNPVLDIGLADFRDPNVFWHAPSARWIMVVVHSTENRAALYASSDLRDWIWLSFIETGGAPGEVWECPLLIELPVEGTGNTRWLFKVDVFSGAPGSGALYRTGVFDGVRFVPDGDWHVVDHGQDFYAAIAWMAPRDKAARAVWIGWMGNHGVQAHLPRQGWRGAMSAPRRMSLVATRAGWKLCQRIEPALLASFVQDVVIDPGSKAVELGPGLLTVESQSFALVLRDGAGRSMAIARNKDRIEVVRRDPETPQLDSTSAAQVSPGAVLSVLFDHGSLELLTDDGLMALTLQHRLSGDTCTLSAEKPLTAVYRASA